MASRRLVKTFHRRPAFIATSSTSASIFRYQKRRLGKKLLHSLHHQVPISSCQQMLMNMQPTMNDTAPLVDYFLDSSLQVDTWPLMGSAWPVVIIVSGYLVFVMWLGPKLMKHRQPFDLKTCVIRGLVPLTLTACYTYGLYLPRDVGISEVLINTKSVSTGHIILDIHMQWSWVGLYMAAFVFSTGSKNQCVLVQDLLDTVFFIVRKKQSHVTFLHVYHHATQVLATWFFLKYYKSEQAAVVGLLNPSVHIIMYSYYFLAALGPSVQRYLWWKRYITQIQIIQLIILASYTCSLVVMKCPLPRIYSFYTAIQCTVFSFLFMNFYIKTYFGKYNKQVLHQHLNDASLTPTNVEQKSK